MGKCCSNVLNYVKLGTLAVFCPINEEEWQLIGNGLFLSRMSFATYIRARTCRVLLYFRFRHEPASQNDDDALSNNKARLA